jgi:hypothetical protein
MRTQSPLTIAYAITIHKSQGLSVYRAVLNPGKKQDFALGRTYVTISCMRLLPGIMFEESFGFKRLKSSTSHITIMRATDAAKCLQQEIRCLSRRMSKSCPLSLHSCRVRAGQAKWRFLSCHLTQFDRLIICIRQSPSPLASTSQVAWTSATMGLFNHNRPRFSMLLVSCPSTQVSMSLVGWCPRVTRRISRLSI